MCSHISNHSKPKDISANLGRSGYVCTSISCCCWQIQILFPSFLSSEHAQRWIVNRNNRISINKLKSWRGARIPWQIAFLKPSHEKNIKIGKKWQISQMPWDKYDLSPLLVLPASSVQWPRCYTYTRCNITACVLHVAFLHSFLICRSGKLSLLVYSKLFFILQLITEVCMVGIQKNSGCFTSLQWEVSCAVDMCYSQ